MPEVTGMTRAGDTLQPGVLVDIAPPAEDLVPQFSEIVGHAWLLRVAAVPCDCSEPTLACGCRTGSLEESTVFLAAPWRARYPDVTPTVPYGAPLLRPAVARFLFRRFVFDVDAAAESPRRGRAPRGPADAQPAGERRGPAEVTAETNVALPARPDMVVQR